MHYAEARGLDKVIDALRALLSEGLADSPCEFLARAAARGGFSDLLSPNPADAERAL
jgi:3-hydroxyacyl-CoA dehydrogenase